MARPRVTVVATQQAAMRALYKAELDKGRDLFGNYFPNAAANLIKLAEGFPYQAMDHRGKMVTLQKPPDLGANIYIVNRMMGVPKLEDDEVLNRLNAARADFIENQLTLGFIQAQVEEILSRANIKNIEAAMWPKQFVTEEDQQDQIQAIATAMLSKLMSLTPDEYEEINKQNSDPSSALEALKGKIGVDLAAVMETVMGKGTEDGDETEDEEVEDA